MSDRFFDKDNNFILWKDEGDLTKASKYQGGNRGGIGLSESLTKKIAKGKVEVGRKFGYLNKPIVVNWGKCGGTSDVVVTYKEDEGLWVPKVFLTQAFNSDWSVVDDVLDKEVGYQGVIGVTNTASALYDELVYKLPQELGEWLYENAETGTGYSSTGNASDLYKGIAIYPDNPDVWTSSDAWGVGIRKKSDIGRYHAVATSYAVLTLPDTLPIWNGLDDDSYYMVIQVKKTGGSEAFVINGQLNTCFVSCDDVSDHIYLRKFVGMSGVPSANNKGSKYFLPKEKFQHYGVITKALEVNWGKCGGNEDVIVTYNEGDSLWIPKVFMTTTSNYVMRQYSTTTGLNLRIYTLPRELGAYLYKVAESNTTDISDYTLNDTSTPGNALAHNYKGIAIYSDNPSSWTSSQEWGVGIRKKNDIGVFGHVNGEIRRCDRASTLESDSAFNDEDFYMVLQDYNGDSSTLITNLSATTVDDGTPSSDHIYLRTYRELTAVPSASNMGSKYTCPSELCSDTTTLTKHTDSLTVNWGKCGGNEDVIVTYNKGEGIWIPNAFLAQGTNGSSYQPKSDQLYLPDGVTKDTSVGYKTWFGYTDCGNITTRQPCSSSSYYLYIAVYKLPQELGRYLYENAECNLMRKTSGGYGPIIDYSGTDYSSTSSFDRNYKGIAIYPDTISDWTSSAEWGIGIRMKKDIPYVGLDENGIPTTNSTIYNDGSDYSAIFNLDQWKALEDDAYYLVAQERGDLRNSLFFLTGQLNSFNIDDSGSDHIYLRHYNTMTSAPSANNKGEKYTLSDFDEHPSLPTPNEDQVEIDWGCGIKTYYKYGEPMYIPRAFLMEAFDPNTKTPKGTSTTPYGNGSVGYYCWDDLSTYKIAVYVLPQELGKYLYESAESITTGAGYYSGGNQDYNRAYKGIAIYPDHVGTDSSSDWTTSGNWAVGIRTGEDILVYGHMSNGVQVSCGSSTQPSGTYENDVYYLVAQLPITSGDTSTQFLYGQLNLFPKDEPIWFRHFKDMTSNPSATNKGKKMVYHPEYYAKPLGGKIFYIDSEDNGATYTFFDSSGNVVSGSTVAELSNAVSYLVEGTPSKDKFYVYYPTKYDSLQWGYSGTATGATGTSIGTGKTNTEIVMTRTDIPSSSIWSKLSEVRNSSEIDDWFIPSKDEFDKFREADLEVWHRGSGGSYLWASTEMEGYNAWYWMNNGNNWSYQSKTNPNYSVFFTRSF